MKDRRTPHQIYYDIITHLIKTYEDDEPLKLTNIQQKSNLGYDKLLTHIKKMIKLKLINNDHTATSKGYIFHKEFTQILLQVNYLQGMFDVKIFPPTPNTKLTTDALVLITEMANTLENEAKKAKTWVKIQEEMR